MVNLMKSSKPLRDLSMECLRALSSKNSPYLLRTLQLKSLDSKIMKFVSLKCHLLRIMRSTRLISFSWVLLNRLYRFITQKCLLIFAQISSSLMRGSDRTFSASWLWQTILRLNKKVWGRLIPLERKCKNTQLSICTKIPMFQMALAYKSTLKRLKPKKTPQYTDLTHKFQSKDPLTHNYHNYNKRSKKTCSCISRLETLKWFKVNLCRP